MSHLIEFEQIRIRLAGKPLLNIAKLSVPMHQCTLLTGRNGSGKTTLFKILSGLLKPDHIRVHYQGLSMNWRQAKPHIQRDVIYLHQQAYLFDASVADNIAYGLRRAGEKKAAAQRKVIQALDWADLTHLAHRPAKQLSGGEKQRVALTRARILAPRLLLLDEPTASMDGEAKQQTSLLLQRLKAEGVSIIISSHEAHTVENIADQHLYLDNGDIRPLKQSAAHEKVTVLNPIKHTQ